MCVSLLGTACNREKNAPATSVKETHPADQQSTPTVAQPTGDSTAALNALTQVLRKYSFEKRRVPATVEELLAAGYVQSLPPPPAGKKFVIDAKRVVVELANQ